MQIIGRDIRKVMGASTLTSDEVRNQSGEDLGKIEEIMLDVPSGRIAYAVLSFGGFLGIGDKLFAVPWQALQLNEDDKCFILNVSKDRLKEYDYAYSLTTLCKVCPGKVRIGTCVTKMAK